MSAFDQAFWSAIDDLNAGRPEPVERYLELVPTVERDELARMLAAVLASRGPQETDAASPEAYARALAAINEVTADTGATEMLGPALKTLRKARGLDRDDVLDALADEFGVRSAEGCKTLARRYHQLEGGKIFGPRVANRLLESLARFFGADVKDFIAGARATGGTPSRPSLAVSMGRGSGEGDPAAATSSAERAVVGRDPDVELVERLFTGGPDA